MKILDLFCGTGGLVQGFRKTGFNITGVDSSEYTEKTFKLNLKSKFKLLKYSYEDIVTETVMREAISRYFWIGQFVFAVNSSRSFKARILSEKINK